MIETKVSVKWNGVAVEKEIQRRLFTGVKRAIQFYFDRLKEKISKWGSFGGKRVVHSSPGEPPRRQTGNLYNSIQQRVSINQYGIYGEVFTDVPYAPTLEYGGELQVDQDDKPHADVKLSNPFVNAITIAPRPVWASTFAECADTMNEAIV